MRKIHAGIVILSMMLITACSEQKPDNILQQKNEAKNQIKNAIAGIDEELDYLGEMLKSASADSKDEIIKIIEERKSNRFELGDKIKRIDDTPDDQWDNFKEDISQTVEKVRKALNNAKDEIREKTISK